MAVKDVTIFNMVPTAVLTFTHNVDFADFHPGFLELLFETTGIRISYAWGHPNVHRVIVSPAGVAYPGDATPGNGSKKVTVVVQGGAGAVMTQVDNVDVITGWVVITKGDHVIAYVPTILATVQVEPT